MDEKVVILKEDCANGRTHHLLGAVGSTACESHEINIASGRFRVQPKSFDLTVFAYASLFESKMTGRGKGKAPGTKSKSRSSRAGLHVVFSFQWVASIDFFAKATDTERFRRGCFTVLGCHTRVSKC